MKTEPKEYGALRDILNNDFLEDKNNIKSRTTKGLTTVTVYQFILKGIPTTLHYTKYNFNKPYELEFYMSPLDELQEDYCRYLVKEGYSVNI